MQQNALHVDGKYPWRLWLATLFETPFIQEDRALQQCHARSCRSVIGLNAGLGQRLLLHIWQELGIRKVQDTVLPEELQTEDQLLEPQYNSKTKAGGEPRFRKRGGLLAVEVSEPSPKAKYTSIWSDRWDLTCSILTALCLNHSAKEWHPFINLFPSYLQVKSCGYAPVYAFAPGLHRRHSGKAFSCQCRRHKRCGFHPWLGKSPGGWHGNPLHTLAWRIPLTEEPGGLESTGSQRVGHD